MSKLFLNQNLNKMNKFIQKNTNNIQKNSTNNKQKSEFNLNIKKIKSLVYALEKTFKQLKLD